MNNKDYNAIAEIIKHKLVGNDLEETALEIAEDLANYFEQENSDCDNHLKNVDDDGYCNNCGYQEANFNKEQFLADCGVE